VRGFWRPLIPCYTFSPEFYRHRLGPVLKPSPAKELRDVEDIKEYKQDCLLDEHRTLSAFVEQEVVATVLCRAFAAAAWMIGMLVAAGNGLGPLAIAMIVFPGLLALWLVDVYFSYVGVVYKVRRLKVRQMLAELPHASHETARGWATPINPFDGAAKGSALRDALMSPWILAPYAILESATLAYLLLG